MGISRTVPLLLLDGALRVKIIVKVHVINGGYPMELGMDVLPVMNLVLQIQIAAALEFVQATAAVANVAKRLLGHLFTCSTTTYNTDSTSSNSTPCPRQAADRVASEWAYLL